MRISRANTYAVVYVGAPYGDNEGGHIVSLHRSESAARGRTDGYRGQIMVALDEPYTRGLQGMTAREYFEQ